MRKTQIQKKPAQGAQFFRVSSHLKSIIGRDLITDDYVAIFELVKNSFDASATNVKIYFSRGCIYVIDDGKGLAYQDIVNKWLFVAYSAKREGIEDDSAEQIDYRNAIKASRYYAGSKGVGRFSCDRLGGKLVLSSRTATPAAANIVHILRVNWADFEESSQEEFINVPVEYEESDAFDVEDGVQIPSSHGTILRISELRETWDRKKILELKASLAKLINPFGGNESPFSIEIIAPGEKKEDDLVRKQYDEDLPPNLVVNGQVRNFIFSTLREKTTWVRTWVDKDRNCIFTELNDRGTLIYRISEPLEFPDLVNSGFECHLFYLNRSAKATFARRMGVNSIKFGSVFLFKNGFRVYPVGEPTDDTFEIDRRKQQGHSRFLGTRDIVGRIDVFGDDAVFRETSSRDKGLILTRAAKQLHDCFWEKCFLRLENYVVGVSWKLKFDMDLDDSSYLSGDEAKAKVLAVLARLTSSPSINVDYFSADLLTNLSNKVDEYPKAIANLAQLAHKVGDYQLEASAHEARLKYVEMQRAEAEAVAFAERERSARKAAELKERKAAASLEVEKKRNLFLTSLQSHDKDVLETLHHQVIIYASNAINNIEASLFALKNGRLSPADVREVLENLLLLNQQVIAASKFATSANFRLDSNSVEEDLAIYVEQYIERICSVFESRIDVEVVNGAEDFNIKFKPIEISIIFDNLIDNAYKAGASKIIFTVSRPEPNFLQIMVEDNGLGLDDTIENHEEIFEKGITTTDGSGLGLYHIRQLLSKMRGSISLYSTASTGTSFIVRIYK